MYCTDKYCMHLYWFSMYATGICSGSKLRTYDAYEAISHYVQMENKEGLGKMGSCVHVLILLSFCFHQH